MSADVSNPFLDDDEDEEPGTEDNKRDSAFALMRKELKASKKELEELRTYRAEQDTLQRAASIQNAAKELGINPKHAAFYPIEQEATPEAIKAWAVEMDMLQVEEGEETPPPSNETGFTPTVVAGGAVPGAKVYTAEEFDQLMEVDPQKAMQVYKAGRVQKEQAPGGSAFVGRDR